MAKCSPLAYLPQALIYPHFLKGTTLPYSPPRAIFGWVFTDKVVSAISRDLKLDIAGPPTYLAGPITGHLRRRGLASVEGELPQIGNRITIVLGPTDNLDKVMTVPAYAVLDNSKISRAEDVLRYKEQIDAVRATFGFDEGPGWYLEFASFAWTYHPKCPWLEARKLIRAATVDTYNRMQVEKEADEDSSQETDDDDAPEGDSPESVEEH